MTPLPDSAAPRQERAFTLIELSIVLAIVGVLAAVSGSRYLEYLDRARTTRAIVELRGIAAQLEGTGGDEIVLPPSLGELGLDRQDPWGNPYQYLRIAGSLPPGLADADPSPPSVAAPPSSPSNGGNVLGSARKDRFLVPINSDFDLYSMGPDGESKPTLSASKSRDDVIRAANGAYYGIAERY